MNIIQEVCRHSYARWVEKRALCAVCHKDLDLPYDVDFTGTFSVEDYERRYQNVFTVASAQTFWEGE